MNTRTKLNGYTFILVNGVWELAPNAKHLCGIVHKVGNTWYYSRNSGSITTKGGFKTHTEAMQALTS